MAGQNMDASCDLAMQAVTAADGSLLSPTWLRFPFGFCSPTAYYLPPNPNSTGSGHLSPLNVFAHHGSTDELVGLHALTHVSEPAAPHQAAGIHMGKDLNQVAAQDGCRPAATVDAVMPQASANPASSQQGPMPADANAFLIRPRGPTGTTLSASLAKDATLADQPRHSLQLSSWAPLGTPAPGTATLTPQHQVMLQAAPVLPMLSEQMSVASPRAAPQGASQACMHQQPGSCTDMQCSVSPPNSGMQQSYMDVAVSTAMPASQGLSMLRSSSSVPGPLPQELGVACMPIKVTLKDQASSKQAVSGGVHTLRLAAAAPLPPPQVISMPAVQSGPQSWQQLGPTLDLEGNSQPVTNTVWTPPMRWPPHAGRLEQQGCSPDLPMTADPGDGDAVCNVVGVAGNTGGEGQSSMVWKASQPPALQISVPHPCVGAAATSYLATGATHTQATMRAPSCPVPVATTANEPEPDVTEQLQRALEWPSHEFEAALQGPADSIKQQEQHDSPGAEAYATCSSVPMQGPSAQPLPHAHSMDSSWPRWHTPHPDRRPPTIDCSGEMSTPTLTPNASDDDAFNFFSTQPAPPQFDPWPYVTHQYYTQGDGHGIPPSMQTPFAPHWLPYEGTGHRSTTAAPWQAGHPHMFMPYPMMHHHPGMPQAQHQQVPRAHPACMMPPHSAGGYPAYYPHGCYPPYMLWPGQRPPKHRKKRRSKAQPPPVVYPIMVSHTGADGNSQDYLPSAQPAAGPTVAAQVPYEMAAAAAAPAVDVCAQAAGCSLVRSLHDRSLPAVPTSTDSQEQLEAIIEQLAEPQDVQAAVHVGHEQGAGACSPLLHTPQLDGHPHEHALPTASHATEPQHGTTAGDAQEQQQQQQQGAGSPTATCGGLQHHSSDQSKPPGMAAPAPTPTTSVAAAVSARYELGCDLTPKATVGPAVITQCMETVQQKERSTHQADSLPFSEHRLQLPSLQTKDAALSGLRMDTWSPWDRVGQFAGEFGGLDHLAACWPHPASAGATSDAPIDAQAACKVVPTAPTAPHAQLSTPAESSPDIGANALQSQQAEPAQQIVECEPGALCATACGSSASEEEQQDVLTLPQPSAVAATAATATTASCGQDQMHPEDIVAYERQTAKPSTESRPVQQQLQGSQLTAVRDNAACENLAPVPAVPEPAPATDQQTSNVQPNEPTHQPTVQPNKPVSAPHGTLGLLRGQRTGIRRPRAPGSQQPQPGCGGTPSTQVPQPACTSVLVPNALAACTDAHQLLQCLQPAAQLALQPLSRFAAQIQPQPVTATTAPPAAPRGQTTSHNKRARTYFEYAKLSWEQEPATQLPRGLGSWVVVARQGNAAKQDKGLVFCRVCLTYHLQAQFSVMIDGYEGGKRSALRDHMLQVPHIRLVNMLEEGTLPAPPTYDHLRETPLPPPQPASENTPDSSTSQKATKPRKKRKTTQLQQQEQPRLPLQALQAQMLQAAACLPALPHAVVQLLGAAAQATSTQQKRQSESQPAAAHG